MHDVQWPVDERQLIIDHYRNRLEDLAREFETRNDAGRKLAAWLRLQLKWAGPNQERGVLSLDTARHLAPHWPTS